MDGFRFDEAPILLRDELGQERGTTPVVDMISYDPVLRQVRVFAEPWDAGQSYRVSSGLKAAAAQHHDAPRHLPSRDACDAMALQLGTFPHGLRWKDWNGKFSRQR